MSGMGWLLGLGWRRVTARGLSPPWYCHRSRFSKAVISVMATLSWMARWAGRAQRPRSGKRGSAGRGRTRAPGGGVCGSGYRDAAGAGTAIKGEKADRNPRAWVSK